MMPELRKSSGKPVEPPHEDRGKEGDPITVAATRQRWPRVTDPSLLFATILGELATEATVHVQEASGPAETASLVTQWIKTHAPLGQIREIEALAEAVIGDRHQAHRWLSAPNLALDDKAPIDLLGSEQGYDRVRNLLLRIEYGVLA